MQPFDALLYRGENQPRTRSMLVAACILERAPERAAIAELFERASRLSPRLRQKVVAPTLSALLPAWIVDPDFDLDQHLRFTQLKRGGTLQAVLDVVQVEVCSRLEPERPLWQAQLVEGLEGGGAALIIKMSHAVADGVGVQRLFETIFMPDRDVRTAPMPPVPIPEDVTVEELTREALVRTPRALARSAIGLGQGLLSAAGSLAANPGSAFAAARDYAASVQRMTGAQGAPAAALKGRSELRRVAAFDVPLAAMKRASAAADASINDVYLCAVAGALRIYLEAMGQPAETVPTALPVNLRRGDEPAAGNHFGAIGLALPVGIADPLQRIARIRAQVLAGRGEPALGLPQTLAPVLARLPVQVTDELARRAPVPDIQASNIMGAPCPIFCAGARVLKVWPFGPVPGIAAMFTMQSMAGTCHVGVNFDAAAITDAERFAVAIQQGFREALALGGRAAPRLRRPWVSRELGS